MAFFSYDFMTKLYKKPALSLLDQLNLLVSRGLVVDDQSEALDVLSHVSYYRLSGYAYPLRKRDQVGDVQEDFIENANWSEVMRLYEFDRKLRMSILSALEKIEVAVRTQLTFHFAHKYGPFGYGSSSNFHPGFNHELWLNRVINEITQSNDEFIKHFERAYVGFPQVPMWMMTEVISLGRLSYLYGGLKNTDKKDTASFFDIHYKRLGDWLHSLTYIRNVCAHHSRLWNRELAIRPDKLKDVEWLPPITPRNDRIFYILLMIRLMLNSISEGVSWTANIDFLLKDVVINPKWRIAMGIPESYQNHPIWKI
uniref:Abi family protein n=2 Tax=Polynucleobacter sp. TaxID=2029855 RepID=UPI0040478388